MKFKLLESQRAKEILETLTVREMISQIVCPSYYFKEDGERLKDVGSIYLHKQERGETKKRVEIIKNNCIPSFILSDVECGAGNMIDGATKFSTMMGVSQANSEELAYELGKISALEAREMGYNWTLAPVVDMCYDFDSPVVSTRSAGNTPEQIQKITSSFMRGLQENGLIATAKHFPGDGFGNNDQHVTTPKNPLSMKDWYQLSGKAFQNIIDDGVISIMPGHISLPAYDDIDEETGFYPPATLSKKLMNNLLRGELGFEGIIISDAINMSGVVGYMEYYKACATFWENGGDCLLFPKFDEIFYTEMEKLIDKGFLKVETIKNRAYRMLCLKDQMGLFKKEKCDIVIDKEHNKEISKRIVEKSVTIVRDRKKLLPFAIEKNTKVLHLVIMNDYESHKEKLNCVFEEIKKYSDKAEQLVDPGPDAIFEICYEKKYDVIICSIGNSLSWGVNVVRLHGPIARNMMGGWMKLGVPILFVSHFHPFIHKEYEASIDTIINTYGYTDDTPKILIQGIVGEKPLNKALYAHS